MLGAAPDWKSLLWIAPGLFLQGIASVRTLELTSDQTSLTLLLGTALLAVGLARLARRKGRRIGWGAMALLGLFGWIVVALLSDRQSRTSALSSQIPVIADAQPRVTPTLATWLRGNWSVLCLVWGAGLLALGASGFQYTYSGATGRGSARGYAHFPQSAKIELVVGAGFLAMGIAGRRRR